MRQRGFKIFSITAVLVYVLSLYGVSAVTPYRSYEYSTDNYNGLITSEKEQANAVAVPDAYSYLTSYNHRTLSGLGVNFSNPEDILTDEFGNLLVLDSGNGRIVLINCDTASVVSVFAGWNYEGKNGDFSQAKGFFALKGTLYICLQDSSEILVARYLGSDNTPIVSGNLQIKSIVRSPDLAAVSDGFVFKPSDIVVDNSERMYVIVQGVYDGLVSLDADGSFLGYMGANKISMSFWDRLWRGISTDAQIEASVDQVPVEFYAMDIDENGFIYTTSKGEEQENTVRKLNLVGNDIMKTDVHYIRGDLSVLTQSGTPGTASNLVDVDVTHSGIYAVLDNARGRVFVYDNGGNMLFAFGGLSAQRGGFSVPCAVTWHKDRLLVLDRGSNQIEVFEPTLYGSTVLTAVRKQYGGEYGDSFESWQKVLTMNPNNEIANCSIGKLMYDKKDYLSAMQYFRIANNKKLYSKAYTKHRSERMEQNGPLIAVALAAALAAFAVIKAVSSLKSVRDRWKYFISEVRKSKRKT